MLLAVPESSGTAPPPSGTTLTVLQRDRLWNREAVVEGVVHNCLAVPQPVTVAEPRVGYGTATHLWTTATTRLWNW